MDDEYLKDKLYFKYPNIGEKRDIHPTSACNIIGINLKYNKHGSQIGL